MSSKLTSSVLIVALLCGPIAAEVTVIDLDGDNGVLIEHSGPIKASPVKIQKIGTTPTTPTIPTPPVTGDKAAEIAAIVATINDSETAKNLYGTLTTIADFVTKGQIKNEGQLENIVKNALDLLLTGDRATTWKPVRDKINAYWVRNAQEGGDLASYAKILNEVASGVNQAGNFDEEAINFEVIIQIVMILLKGNLTVADYVQIATLVIQLFRGN